MMFVMIHGVAEAPAEALLFGSQLDRAALIAIPGAVVSAHWLFRPYSPIKVLASIASVAADGVAATRDGPSTLSR